jgi:DNA-binding transcriptional regulator YhcF (GntR family)
MKGSFVDKTFEGHSPIYLQLAEMFRLHIASGTWKLGSRIQSVRELAVECRVNPNTIQRALVALEHEKLVITERTSGRRITDDRETVRKLRKDMADKALVEFTQRMHKIGFIQNEVLKMTADYLRREAE